MVKRFMANKKLSKSMAARFLGFLWKNDASGLGAFLAADGKRLKKSRKYWLDTIAQLKRSGAVEPLNEIGNISEQQFHLTPKGMLRGSGLYMDRSSLKKLSGERRLIVFDVPEENRLYRDYFRQLMKDLGCEMVQLSVWQADFEIPEDFSRLIKELSLQERVIVYKVKPEETLFF